MNINADDKDYSDDEIFLGKLTIKEVKKHVMMKTHRHSLSCTKTDMRCSDSSVKLIETCSEPELKSRISLDDSYSSLCEGKATSSCDITSDNQSFLEMEKMVSELLLVDKKGNEELDNTLDVVEYILNNTPSTEHCHKVTRDTERNDYDANDLQGTETSSKRSPSPIKMLEIDNVKCSSNTDHTTPTKEELLLKNCKSVLNDNRSSSKTVNRTKQNVYQSSPSVNDKQSVSVFKTPKSTVPLKKYLLTPKNISKLNYQHITSPVATYIKNGPQVPLFKDVKPKKPLLGMSSIPKPLKSSENKNKENINLPSVAYKNAKSVKVIKMPDEERLPESQWANQLSSSLLKPIVIKHEHRENNSVNKSSKPQTEDSFANLTLHQADVSVCTQKTAYNKVK